MNINKNLFDALPIGFFNCLASGSSNRIYSDCLLLIYHEYDREITYRIARSRIRDALAIYLLDIRHKLCGQSDSRTSSIVM